MCVNCRVMETEMGAEDDEPDRDPEAVTVHKDADVTRMTT